MVEDEVAHAVDDEAASIPLGVLLDVGVVPGDDIDAHIDERLADLLLPSVIDPNRHRKPLSRSIPEAF